MSRRTSRYPVVIERGGRNYSAFSPDLPGCIATGRTLEETLRRMEKAIEMHVEGLRADGLKVPRPSRRLASIVRDERALYTTVPASGAA